MSYILDALRKSEQERRQIDAPVNAPPSAESVELPRQEKAWWLVATFLLAAVVGVSAYLMLRRGSESTNSESIVAPTNEPAASAPVIASAPVHPPEPVVNTGIRPAPELKPHPLLNSQVDKGAVRSLEDETRAETSAPRAAPRERRPPPVGVVASPATSTSGDSVKFLRSMSPDFQRSLPELTVNIHIYAPREADRILYINNRQYHAGDRVHDGVHVEEIVEDGAVLSFRGQKFKLPRPS